ncbi:MAG: leucine-rich repeat protein [Clostridia bacterium]|nr:leucine-rich repeat protein [Clostridia bacterium]
MKNTLKRSLSVLIALTVFFGSFAFGFSDVDWSEFAVKAEAAEKTGICGDEIFWSLNTETGVLAIEGIGEMTDWPEYCDVPWYWDNKYIKTVTISDGITSIGMCAFFACSNLTNITIPTSVISIRDWAFAYCDSLTSIVIPASVTSIGYTAFGYCNGFTSFKIPDSVKSIGNFAFRDCENLESITVGNSVESIGDGAFYNCAKLVNINIPDSVKIIGVQAFYNCSALQAITLSDSIENIGSDAFHYTGYFNNNDNWENNALYINNHLIYTKGNSTIKEGTVLIANGAFGSSCTTVTIPATVKNIGNDAFKYCSSLESISVHKDNKNFTVVDGILYNKNKTQLIVCAKKIQKTSLTIPDSVTDISSAAFAYCNNFTNITIPDSVTNIGETAFYACEALESVNIPDSITSIGKHTFGYCTALKSITIPDSVTSIGAYAFEHCEKITSVDIPDSVEIIDEYAFFDCYSLANVKIGNSVEYIGKDAFAYCAFSDLIIPDSVQIIEDAAFYGNDKLNSVIIGNGVEYIGAKAFVNCDTLTSVTLPFTADTAIYAFGQCDKVILTKGTGEEGLCDLSDLSPKELIIQDGVTTVWRLALNNLPNLTSITIPDSVETIGNGAFNGCTALESVTIPDSVTYIGDNAFRNCTSLNSIKIPESVTSIGSGFLGGYTFYGCTALENISIPDGVEYIDDYLFYGCTNLTNITIPESVTRIGEKAFYDSGYYNDKSNWENGVLYLNKWLIAANSSVSGEYKIKDGTLAIAPYAFKDCDSFESVTIPNSIKEMRPGIFENCTALKSITIPKSVTNIYGMVFRNCTSLTDVYYEGTEEEWKKISINTYGNEVLSTATIHYKNVSEDELTTKPVETTKPATEPTTTKPVEVPTTTKPAVTEPSTTKPVEIPTTTKPATEPDKPVETTKPTTAPTTKPVSTTEPEPIKEEIIKKPSTSTVKYGETLILHADFESIPEGATIEWSVEGKGVTIVPSEDGKTCAVTSTSTGDVTVTAKYTDADGIEHVSEQEIKSNASFWQKIVSFFKNLFGINRIIEQVIKF